MDLNVNFLYIICLGIISLISSQKVEQKSVQIGQSLSFDCKADELIYFGPQLNDWSEVKDGDNNLNLKFNYLTQENILRVTADPVDSVNTGFYACRKPVWTTTTMSRIYQVTVADVDAFYWTYVCHGAVGSCLRSEDDSVDRTSNSLEVADETNVDLFCCATVIGYKNVNINMNQVGDLRGKVYIKRKQDVDGSLVVCANQHTFLSRISTKNSRVLTCELVLDQEIYSTISTNIIMKNAMPANPDFDPPYGYNPPSKDDSDDYERRPNSRAKSRIGKKLIIISSIIGSVLLLTLIFLIVFILYRRNKRSTQSQTPKSDYIAVRKHEKTEPDKDPEYAYIDPVPLYQNTPIYTRH